MEKSKKILGNIIFNLQDVWKRHFGLYTQYIGYMTPEMLITLSTIKRIADSTWEIDCSELSLNKTNELAEKFDLYRIPVKDEFEAVLPKLWAFLEKFDLSEDNISENSWNEYIKYLENKIERM